MKESEVQKEQIEIRQENSFVSDRSNNPLKNEGLNQCFSSSRKCPAGLDVINGDVNSINVQMESGQQQNLVQSDSQISNTRIDIDRQENIGQKQQQSESQVGKQSGSSVMQQLQLNEESYKKLLAILYKHGLPTENPILRLEVIPQNNQVMYSHQRNFSLIKSDVEQVFKVFGEIKEVAIEPQQGFALVTFQDIVSAFFAQQSLNNYYLSKYNANLQVKWCNSTQVQTINQQQQNQQQQEFIQQNQENIYQQQPYYQYNQMANSQNYGNIYNTNQQNSQNNMTQFQYQNVYNMNQYQNQFKLNQSQQQQINNSQNIKNDDDMIKYTCRFDIQIDNDKEFQVARRLIGARGCNMKRIIESCVQSCENQQEIVKLRLRGKGSGFREGPRQEESNEPLHLCVSSKYYDKYQIACNHVQELILNVYEDYKRFCEKNKKDLQFDLQIKKVETVTGRRAVPQTPPKLFMPANQQSQGIQQNQFQNDRQANQQKQYQQNVQNYQQQMRYQSFNNQEIINQNNQQFTPIINQRSSENIMNFDEGQNDFNDNEGIQMQRSYSQNVNEMWNSQQFQ